MILKPLAESLRSCLFVPGRRGSCKNPVFAMSGARAAADPIRQEQYFDVDFPLHRDPQEVALP
jgi:hypothetical protein